MKKALFQQKATKKQKAARKQAAFIFCNFAVFCEKICKKWMIKFSQLKENKSNVILMHDTNAKQTTVDSLTEIINSSSTS